MYNKLPRRLATEACLAARTRRLNRAISAEYDGRLRELGISVAQLDVLVTLLYEGEPVRPADLARSMLMERSTVSRNIARLEALGLVAMSTGSDHREKAIRVTRKGERLVQNAEACWAEAQDAVRKLLGPQGVRAIEMAATRIGEER